MPRQDLHGTLGCRHTYNVIPLHNKNIVVDSCAQYYQVSHKSPTQWSQGVTKVESRGQFLYPILSQMNVWMNVAATPATVIPVLSATLATPIENSRWTLGTYTHTHTGGWCGPGAGCHEDSPLLRWSRMHWRRLHPPTSLHRVRGQRSTRMKVDRDTRWQWKRTRSWSPADEQ